LAVDRIHIVGASGSGTSTLAAALSERYGYAHIDTDRYFWEPSDPPFQRAREVSARQRLLGEALDAHPRWILAGSLCGWGDIFIPRFELVIFLRLPPDIRMARLRERERRRYGADALAPGGRMHEAYEAFMRWPSNTIAPTRASAAFASTRNGSPASPAGACVWKARSRVMNRLPGFVNS
jgi:adenylate kinase family enzyme